MLGLSGADSLDGGTAATCWLGSGPTHCRRANDDITIGGLLSFVTESTGVFDDAAITA